MIAVLRILVLMAGVLVLGPGIALAGKSDRVPDYASVSAAIAQILDGSERLPLPLQRIRPALKAHYIRDNGTIYWVGTGRMTPFIQRLSNAWKDGLNPADYPVESLITVRDAVSPSDPAGAAQAELIFSSFFVAYAADLKIGRVTPQKVDPRLFRNRKTIDVLRVLTELKKKRDPGKFLSAFESRNPHYQALKKMLVLYRALENSGDWPSIPAGPNIKPGGSDNRLPQIRNLLQLTGDYQGSGGGSAYDPATVEAVQRFQARHGLEAKGLVGKQTLLAMNMRPAERVRQITLNMERWRWMPENLGERHLMVNLAAYELQDVQDQSIVERMKVVVGAVATQTPEFSDELEYVDFNPTWTVPYSIATKEMLPKLKQNPGAYAAEFDVFMNGKLVSWQSINWSGYGAGQKFPFTFRQRPGPKNALGRVKFMLPNPHNIYLHDTPAKSKFLETTRAFSHGCIRLSRPIDFAYRIVGGMVGWSNAKIDQTIASGKTTRVSLPKKVPVHLIYATAFQGSHGVEFRPDIYGRDRKLNAALFGKPVSLIY